MLVDSQRKRRLPDVTFARKSGKILRVEAGLVGDCGEGRALLLRLHHPDGDAVHEQEVVKPAAGERDFAESDPLPCGEVQRLAVLDDPTRRDEHRVDLLAG